MTARDLLTYGCTLVIMLALDAVFLGLIAAPLFRATLGDILLQRFRPAPAILFYLLYAFGVVFFASLPARDGGWTTALLRGALFGLLAYATYDFTNYATLRPWTLRLVVTDLIWGTVATAIASGGGMLAGDGLFRLLRGAGGNG